LAGYRVRQEPLRYGREERVPPFEQDLTELGRPSKLRSVHQRSGGIDRGITRFALRLRAPPAKRIEILERVTQREEIGVAGRAGRVGKRPQLRAQQNSLL